jgi:hypothetical protein
MLSSYSSSRNTGCPGKGHDSITEYAEEEEEEEEMYWTLSIR